MLTLHLGAHKTATTHLQRLLTTNREVIAAAGLTCLCPPDLRGGALRMGYVASGAGPAEASGAPLRARLAGAGDVLISEENILGTAHDPSIPRLHLFYPDAAVRLGRVLAAAGRIPARLLMAVRDPAGFLTSAYSQRLLSGEIEPFEAYLQGCDPARLRWSDLVSRLCAVAGVSACVIWRFEDWPDIAPVVLREMLPDPLASRLRLATKPSHPGLSRRAHAWVMEQRARGAAHSDIAHEARRRFPKSDSEPAFRPFSVAQRDRSAEAYAADLARIAAMPGVTLLDHHGREGQA